MIHLLEFVAIFMAIDWLYRPVFIRGAHFGYTKCEETNQLIRKNAFNAGMKTSIEVLKLMRKEEALVFLAQQIEEDEK